MMDGIAFAADHIPATGPFLTAGLHAAGDPPPSEKGKIWEIMTGAILPEDCDTVVPYEDLENGRPRDFTRGQFIHREGSDAAAGSELVPSGVAVGPVEIAIAASVGCSHVEVFRRPRVAILSTGDEAVPIESEPQPWQIRRSNGVMLEALVQRRGNDVTFHDHAPDDPEKCGALLDAAFATADVVLICGGISKGKKDFIRELVEARLGKPAFHGVAQRPGKPLAFWSGPPAIFALPGNPVSVLATFTRHVVPTLCQMEGQSAVPQKIRMKDLPPALPKLSWLLTVTRGADGMLHARPPSNSGDFISVAGCTGLIEVPAGSTSDEHDFYPFPH